MMKSKILNGKEIKTGGSISIPMDIRTEATTISMIRNGTNMMNPISNAFLSSPMTKAGIKTQVDMSAGVFGRLDLDKATKRPNPFHGLV